MKSEVPSWKKYELKYPERVAARKRAYRARNKEKVKLWIAAWKKLNRERVNEWNRNWYWKIKRPQILKTPKLRQEAGYGPL